jgi:hypothetical protein
MIKLRLLHLKAQAGGLKRRVRLPEDVTERLARTMDLHGVCQSTMTQLTTGAFLTGYLLALGSDSILIGIAAGLPLFVKLIQLVASWRIERSGAWWRVAIQGACVGRLPLYIAAAIPFLPFSEPLRAWLLVAVIATTAFGGTIWELAFITWMAALIPERIRGAFWGVRTRVAELTGLIVALLAAYLFDRWRDANAGSLAGFSVVFGVAAVAGTLGILFLRMIPIPATISRHAEPVSLKETLARPARDENFRRLLYFVGVWGLSVGLMGPFTSVYMLQELHLPFLAVTIVGVLPSAMIALTQAYYGKLADHFGNRPVLRIATYNISISTVLWLTSGPERVWPLYVLQVISGLGWSAYNISMNNMVLKLAPPASRSSYIATLGAVYAVTQAVAPVLGGITLNVLRAAGMKPLTTYYVLFGISALLRIVATPMPGRVHEERGTGVGHLIRVLGRVRSMSAATGADTLFDYTYTQLARAADFVTREHGTSRRVLRRRTPRRRAQS